VLIVRKVEGAFGLQNIIVFRVHVHQANREFVAEDGQRPNSHPWQVNVSCPTEFDLKRSKDFEDWPTLVDSFLWAYLVGLAQISFGIHFKLTQDGGIGHHNEEIPGLVVEQEFDRGSRREHLLTRSIFLQVKYGS